MKEHLPIVQLVLCFATLCGVVVAQGSVAAPGQEFAIKTFGGFPISDNISSLWLTGSDGRPLVMVYFYGPKDWYETQWNINSKFEDGRLGWAELRSENVTVRVEVYPETWEVAIQASKFSVRQSNTFLVLHTGELLVPQKLIPLGVFDLPPSTDKAASVLLFRANLELAERIDLEGRAGGRIVKSPHRFLTPPCNGLESDSLLPSAINRGKLLPSTYFLPCRRSPVSSTYVQ